MASDNLTSLILGALDRSEKVSNILLEDVLARRRAKELKDYELEIYKGKMPSVRDEEERKNKMQLDRELAVKKYEYENKPKSDDTISGRDILDIQSGNIDPKKSYPKSVIPVINTESRLNQQEGQKNEKLRIEGEKAKTFLDSSIEKYNAIRERAAEILKNKSLPSATGLIGGKVTSNIWGTPQYDVGGDIENLKVKIGFGSLQEMRNASPTGGALGPVSDTENLYLQNALENLDKSQSTEKVKENLNDVIRIANQAKTRLINSYNNVYLPHSGGYEETTTQKDPKSGFTPEEEVEFMELEKRFGGKQ